MSWQSAYLQRFYHSTDGWVDGTQAFHQLCASVIPAGAEILEIGAGPSNPTSQFIRSLGTVHGVDVDPAVHSNPFLNTAHVLTDDRYPFADGSIDACVSNYVIEHVADPERHLREVWRVLKPGGVYVFRTPNVFHYTALVSRLTPHRVHRLLANRLRNLAPEAHDPYPTVYAMNSRAAVVRHATDANFTVEQLLLVEKEPWYGLSSRILFLGFMLYERLVNASRRLAFLRANIFAVVRKPG